MIKLERTSVMNLDNALRGMRNPLNSWNHADSYWTHIEDPETLETANYEFFVGENDMNLAQRLVKSGSDHRKFMRQIFVSVDITAPLYWWKEYDTYKIGTVANSCSTMHKIHAKEFTFDDFSCERMSDEARACLEIVIHVLENRRQKFIETKDTAYWNDMIQLLPASYNQMRTCTLNYENLIGIYNARRNHKLREWVEYCKWIEDLPYFKEFCLQEK